MLKKKYRKNEKIKKEESTVGWVETPEFLIKMSNKTQDRNFRK